MVTWHILVKIIISHDVDSISLNRIEIESQFDSWDNHYSHVRTHTTGNRQIFHSCQLRTDIDS